MTTMMAENFDMLERTIKEIEITSSIYNNASYNEDDDCNTRLTVLTKEEFMKAKKVLQQIQKNSSPDAKASPTEIKIEVNVVLTSADGGKFDLNLVVSLPQLYPKVPANVSSAIIKDLTLQSQHDEFSNYLNEMAKDLAGNEALVELIQKAEDYACEYIANFGHEQFQYSWDKNRNFFVTSLDLLTRSATEYSRSREGSLDFSSFDETPDFAIRSRSDSFRKQKIVRAKSKPRVKPKIHKSKPSVASGSAKKQSKSKSFDQRLDDLREFKEEHGHCSVPYTYEKNQPLSNWCSNIRYSYGLYHRGLTPTIKMTKERIDALIAVGFDFAGLKTQQKKKDEASSTKDKKRKNSK